MQRYGHRVAALALAAALPLAAAPSAATEWAIAPEQSRLLFEYERGGEPRQGSFAVFAGGGELDPAALDEATLELRIETASIDLGNSLANGLAASPEWFDSETHPFAVYRLRTLTPLEGGRYRATGDLTIRGRTRPIATGLVLEVGEEAAYAVGSLRLDRTEFEVGTGLSALLVRIGDEVAVRFRLTALPAP
jgi:polyisoprenoid-binding protein YceI